MHPHFLGKFKNELPPGEEISQWIATAPKSYAYRLKNSGETKIVMKGISLNATAKKLLGFEQMRDFLLNNLRAEGSEKINVPVNNFFVRDSLHGRIYTKKSKKTLTYKYDKRNVLADDYTTLPYGFRENDDASPHITMF